MVTIEQLQKLRNFRDYSTHEDILEIAEQDISLIIQMAHVDFIAQSMTGNTDWSGLFGLKILDLGCGSRYSPSYSYPFFQFPYFPYLCVAHGAEVYGIDLSPQHTEDQKVYNHIQADLVEIATTTGLISMPGLPEHEFDVIHCCSLFDSPVFTETLRRKKGSKIQTSYQFRDLVMQQITPLMKEGGIYVENPRRQQNYRKVQGVLLELT